jgi:S1-C subfamily serine protease
MIKLFAVAAFALIPPYYLDCVVAIGRDVPVMVNGSPVLENGTAKLQWEPIASGFLYGEPTGEKNDKGEPLYRTFLVTNRHVVQGAPELRLRFNPKESKPAKEYALPLADKGKPTWFAPPDPQFDVAVVGVNMDFLRNDEIKAEFIPGDQNAADVAKAKDLGVSEGDGVFVLGFPLQLVGGARNFVIARQGIIARIGDALEGFSKTFLIDTFIFPGNSGGPVILRPEALAITGTKHQGNALLIGVVSSFQTYQEIAVSQQTGRPRIMFEENAGLANVVPVDQIKAAIAEAIRAEKTK